MIGICNLTSFVFSILINNFPLTKWLFEFFSFLFRSKDWRDKHVLIVHEGQKPYVCDACGKAFGMKQGLKEHYIIVHEKNGKLKCEQCNFTAPNNSRLSFHVKTVHEKKATFNCAQCSFVCYRKDGLKAHIDAVHEKKRPHKCEYCEGAFFLRRDKERHLLKFHNIDVKKGGGGGLMWIMKNLLKDNLILKKNSLFLLEVNLKVGIFIGTKFKKCEQCNFKDPNNSRLSFHLKTVHEKKATFNCAQCSFVCYSKDGLKAHIDAVHEKKRPHKCDYCEGAFI